MPNPQGKLEFDVVLTKLNFLLVKIIIQKPRNIWLAAKWIRVYLFEKLSAPNDLLFNSGFSSVLFSGNSIITR